MAIANIFTFGWAPKVTKDPGAWLLGDLLGFRSLNRKIAHALRYFLEFASSLRSGRCGSERLRFLRALQAIRYPPAQPMARLSGMGFLLLLAGAAQNGDYGAG